MASEFVPPPANRSHLDDIDGDDDAPVREADVQSDAATASTPAAAAAASASSTAVPALPSPPPARAAMSALDDVDDDMPTAITVNDTQPAAAAAASSSVSSSAASAAAPSPPPAELTPGALEVQRVLDVLKADKELREEMAASSAVAVSGGVAAPSSAPAAQPNHFAVLGLQPPTSNAAGEGMWLVTDDGLKRAFKRLVVLIHPDKNPVAGAKDAFEAVKSAHATLSSESDRYDFVKRYCAFRRSVAQRAKDYLPPSAVAATLSETIEQGRRVSELKKQQADRFAARLQAQSEAKMSAIRAGEVERKRKEDQARQDELKRKVMSSNSRAGSDDDSDEERHMSVADKIRAAKQKDRKKVRLL